MPRWFLVVVFAGVAVVLTACTSAGIGKVTPVGASSAPAATGPAQTTVTCKPSGTSLQISAHNIKFDKSCLAAPAGKPFTITFDNMDSGVPHDVAIYTNSSATKSLFVGAIVTGPTTTTYHVPALTAGTYYFRCNVHPTLMFGTFIVGTPTSVAAPAATSTTSTAQAAACTPSGTSLQISAHNIKFDKSCLAAPAGKPFTITFDNMDSGVPHDVAIYTNSSATKSLFVGAIVTGPTTTTYHVPALTAGTYYFRCNVHPTLMFGTFIVG